MGVVNYGTSTDSLASPSLASWAASVSTALDGSDTTVNTRLAQRKMPLTAQTGNYTLTASDEVVTCNGTLTITLPTAVGATGKQYVIRNIATTTVTIARTSSQTVDGCSGTITLAGKGAFVVVSDGANWIVTSAQYTDESVGRRIFTWSSALSSGATTGWQMTYGDTGARSLTLAQAGSDVSVATMTSCRLRRSGSTVTAYVDYITAASGVTSPHVPLVLPTGFRPPDGTYGLMTGYGEGNLATIHIGSGNINVYSATTGYTRRIRGTWDTAESWPSSLPGSSSGSIPAS